MAKRSLGEVFIRSMVRQVGRDAGKVVSNQAFGDAHSTPIRMVKSADTSLQYVGSTGECLRIVSRGFEPAQEFNRYFDLAKLGRKER